MSFFLKVTSMFSPKHQVEVKKPKLDPQIEEVLTVIMIKKPYSSTAALNLVFKFLNAK